MERVKHKCPEHEKEMVLLAGKLKCPIYGCEYEVVDRGPSTAVITLDEANVTLNTTAMTESGESDLIITTHPTMADLQRAEAENKMVMVFAKYPDRVASLVYGDLSVETKNTVIKCWSDGFLQGCGIVPSLFLTLFVVGRDLDIEEAIAAYKRAYKRAGTDRGPEVQSLG